MSARVEDPQRGLVPGCGTNIAMLMLEAKWACGQREGARKQGSNNQHRGVSGEAALENREAAGFALDPDG